MWKTLTAKSKWLPVAARLFQGKKINYAPLCLVCAVVCDCDYMSKVKKNGENTCDLVGNLHVNADW